MCCWLFGDGIYMVVPRQLTVYVYSKIFSCVQQCFISCSLTGSLFMFQLWCVVGCRFHPLSMDGVCCVDGFGLISYTKGKTFLFISHLFSHSWSLQILLYLPNC